MTRWTSTTRRKLSKPIVNSGSPPVMDRRASLLLNDQNKTFFPFWQRVN